MNRWWVIAFWVPPIVFLFLFSENLHCDQYASFLTATFGARHAEDEFGRGQIPWLYSWPAGLLLRPYAVVSILLAVFGPGILWLASSRWRIGRRAALAFMFGSMLLPYVNSRLLGQPVLGQRFDALGLPTTLVGCLIALASIAPVYKATRAPG